MNVRVGNAPDVRLTRLLHEHLPRLMLTARERFTKYHDLLSDYGYGAIQYPEFAWRVRRRERGEREDGPTPENWEIPF